jgi:hypothetical protein
VAVTLALAMVALAPLALAQKKDPKGGAKPATSASASASTAASSTASTTAAPAATPSTTAEPATSTSAGTSGEGKPPATEVAATSEPSEMAQVEEDPMKRYYFVGMRYRGTIIPAFIEHLFVDEGGTFYSNSVGIEADLRKDSFSLIPAFSYVEYGTGGPVLFHQKNKDNEANNWSYVDSSLKGLYLTLDALWSVPIDEKQHWQFEYGFGVGIGFIFGSLVNNWVYDSANGPLVNGDGRHFAPCQKTTDGTPVMGQMYSSCDPHTHSNADTAKVGGYQEQNWFNGGSVPVIFPHIALPILGVRYKPIKAFETRFGIGFSLTGFFFGLSGDYGLEQPKKDATKTGSMNAGARMR